MGLSLLLNIKAGNGGGGGTGGNGGLGGAVNTLIFSFSGNGGSGDTGATGGAGGSTGTFTTNGGNGSAASGSTAGAVGGNGGSLVVSGTSASGATIGQNGGGINLTGGAEVESFGGGVFSMTTPTTVANTTSATTLIGTGYKPGNTTNAAPTIGANVLVPGGSYHVHAIGYYSDLLTPTSVITLSLGGTAIAANPAATLGTAVTNDQWSFDCDFVCQTNGASGTVEAQGVANYMTASAVFTPSPIVNTSAATINTTIANAIGFTWTWSAASASNTATCSNFVITRNF